MKKNKKKILKEGNKNLATRRSGVPRGTFSSLCFCLAQNG